MLYSIYHPQTFFFFQAEDGIRDADVTGVQTCALPICQCDTKCQTIGTASQRLAIASTIAWYARSEERRVGKECRSRWVLIPLNNKHDRSSVDKPSCTPYLTNRLSSVIIDVCTYLIASI